MCGRFTQLFSWPELAQLLGELVPGVEELLARYNIAPSQSALVLRRDQPGAPLSAAALRWGLIPAWAKDPKIGNALINARCETLTGPALLVRPVSTYVNNPSHDAKCIM